MRSCCSGLTGLSVIMAMHRTKLQDLRPGFAILLVALAVTLPITAAIADTLRWPAATSLPKPLPPPASPPAVLERPASAYLTRASSERSKGDATCREGQVCVICVAACDNGAPRVVQNLKPRTTGEPLASGIENNSDGVADNAPRFARQEWAGITCGWESGCRVSGVIAPPRTHYYDVRISVSRSHGGASSWYIDGP
jgi:hypothetical protein